MWLPTVVSVVLTVVVLGLRYHRDLRGTYEVPHASRGHRPAAVRADDAGLPRARAGHPARRRPDGGGDHRGIGARRGLRRTTTRRSPSRSGALAARACSCSGSRWSWRPCCVTAVTGSSRRSRAPVTGSVTCCTSRVSVPSRATCSTTSRLSRRRARRRRRRTVAAAGAAHRHERRAARAAVGFAGHVAVARPMPGARRRGVCLAVRGDGAARRARRARRHDAALSLT